MVNVKKITLEKIRVAGFNSRSLFNKFIIKNNLRSLRNETESKFLKRIKAERIKIKKEKSVYNNFRNKIKKLITKLNNNMINEVVIEVSEMPISQVDLFKLILIFRNRKPTIMKTDINNTYTTLNEFNKQQYLNLLNIEFDVEEEDSFHSFIYTIKNNARYLIIKNPYEYIEDEENEPIGNYELRKGAFFKYTNKLNIDLERYGIFKKVKTGQYDATDTFFKQYDNYLENNYKDNCLYKALEAGGMKDDKLQNLKLYFKNRHISINNIKSLCEEEQINIYVKSIRNKEGEEAGKTNNIKYGNEEYEEKYYLGLLDNHYFINEKTNYTKYSIENYNIIKDKKDFNYIYNSRGDKDKKRVIETFELIKILLDNKKDYLEEITIDEEILFSNHYDKFIDDEIKTLEYNEDKQREENEILTREEEGEEEGEEEDKKSKLVFFDCETDPNKIHKVYLICSIDENDNIKDFQGENLVYLFLNSLEDNTILYAHNAGYDFRFIYKYLTIEKFVSKGKKLMFVNAIFKKSNGQRIKIKIRNSLNMINMPLRDFNECFDINYKENIKNPDYEIKEVMPYKFYTEENIKIRYCKINDALEYVKPEEKEQFLKNINKWNIKYEDKYDIIEYSKNYCILDCKILKKGFLTFRDWMLNITKLDINKFVSLPAISQEFLIKNDCYNGCYYLQGIPQLFISRCVVGGRTMIKDNKKCISNFEEDGYKNDFDGVSLYPSAMHFIKGFLKGMPKVLKNNLNEEYSEIPNFLKSVDGYFIKIKVLSVGINRHFPLGSIISKDKTRNFTNNLVGEIQYLDNYALEDLIEFQKISFIIEQGYYFNEGINNKINDVMLYLFNERVKMKKKENPCQMVFKELMNSAYGKTILKPIEYETKIFNNTNSYNKFINRNYEFINEIVILDGDENSKNCKRLVKVIKNIMVHKNIPHVGVQVLSRSKRIMNEVICLAEDNNIEIFYQDTDSMHLKDKDIKLLTKLYFEKYGRELEGKNLGQFHSDFDMSDIEKRDNIKIIDIKATDSIFCAKKMYIDKLEGTNKETGEKIYSYHSRMKGINEAGINHTLTIKENNLSDIWSLYEKLYKGDTVKMDLGAGGQKCIFNLNKDFTINTVNEFIRNIKVK